MVQSVMDFFPSCHAESAQIYVKSREDDLGSSLNWYSWIACYFLVLLNFPCLEAMAWDEWGHVKLKLFLQQLLRV